MAKKEHRCGECPNRKKYDEKPNSLIGRVWRWHINFCPGWRAYVLSLSEEERLKIKNRYNIKK